MGKKQHQKDKLYITNKEWQEEWGGKKEDKRKPKFKRLPFNYCSISLQPFENPLCTKEGVTFDLMSIVPFLKKYKKSPVTGESMSAKDLIKLHFHKNANGDYHCPVMYKIFNENSHIVAIKTTGNVFSYEAVEELNLKPKNFKDLLSSEAFIRKDIITIQDPSKLEKFNISEFYHIKNNLKVEDEDEIAAQKNPMYRIRKANLETENTLKELEKTYKDPTEVFVAFQRKQLLSKDVDVKVQSYLKSKSSKPDEPRFLAHYSTGAMSGSFTSTSEDRSNIQQAAGLHEDVVRYDRVKKLGKKGYVRMTTSKGHLNLELHCEMVHKACENFLKLCAKGYYDNTIFHRLIKHFMVQGGDPTATGKGGESIWGEKFKDEFKPNLSHSGRGILSMANSGKNTNGSQFFITFRSCQHLDNKHTIFGRVVGGLDVLNDIEAVKVDKNDKPNEKGTSQDVNVKNQEEIRILNTTIFTNPYDEIDEQLNKEREEELKKAEEERELQKVGKVAKDDKIKKQKVYRSSGVGKYIPTNISKRMNEDTSSAAVSTTSSKKAKKSSGFSDFSSW